MQTIQQRILEFLKPRDSKNPMSRVVLLNLLLSNGEDISDRQMRLAVAEMVTQGEVPIGTNTQGYFMVRTIEDLEAADGQLKAKQQAICDRRNALLRAYQSLQRDNTPQDSQRELFEREPEPELHHG